MKEFQFSKQCLLFPMMPPKRMEELVQEMRAGGFDSRFPIVLLDEDTILDGRNRYLAARSAGVEAKFIVFDELCNQADAPRDPLLFVMRANHARRDLTDDQRAMIAQAAANMRAGDNQHASRSDQNDPTNSVSLRTAAKEMSVTLIRAKRARALASLANSPEQLVAEKAKVLTGAVQAGEKKLNAALAEVQSVKEWLSRRRPGSSGASPKLVRVKNEHRSLLEAMHLIVQPLPADVLPKVRRLFVSCSFAPLLHEKMEEAIAEHPPEPKQCGAVGEIIRRFEALTDAEREAFRDWLEKCPADERERAVSTDKTFH